MSPSTSECRFCLAQHPDRELCDPAKRVLDALIDQGMSFNLPTLEFPEPVYTELGEPGDTYLVQMVIYAAVVEVAGVPRPTLVFTGRDHTGKPLGRWVYPGDNPDHQRHDQARRRDGGAREAHRGEGPRRTWAGRTTVITPMFGPVSHFPGRQAFRA